jgi:DNA-binding NarL/FixJ family response regulator
MANVRVLVVDRNELFRNAISMVLKSRSGIEVGPASEDMPEYLKTAGEFSPDVALIEKDILDENPPETVSLSEDIVPHVQIIMIAHSELEPAQVSGMMPGISGILDFSKHVTLDHLVTSILAVYSGSFVMSRPINAKLIDELKLLEEMKKTIELNDDKVLTRREHEVIVLLARGLSNRGIADSLCISENTVKIHIARILGKLHMHKRYQAAIWAIENNQVIGLNNRGS